LWREKVQGDALLARVQIEKWRAGLWVRHPVAEGTDATKWVSLRRLYLDDLHSQLREYLGAKAAGHVPAGIEDGITPLVGVSWHTFVHSTAFITGWRGPAIAGGSSWGAGDDLGFALDLAKPPEWYFTTLNVFAVPVALTVAPIESRVWREPV
jgi:hypothetical protein